MAYPRGATFNAKNTALDPAQYNNLFTGMATLEQALAVMDSMSGIADCIFLNLCTRPATTTPQGTWIREVAATELWSAHYTNKGGPSATGDNFTLDQDIPSTGIWQLRINACKGPNAGILKVYVDTVQVGAGAGYDLYNAAVLAPLNIAVIADISPAPAVVLTAGKHTLTFKIDGHNGAAVGFDLYMSGIDLVRTA